MPGDAPRSQNARTHGLTASAPRGEADRAAFEETLARWTQELGPDCAAESILVHRVAMADVRLRRCAEVELAALDLHTEEALRSWEKRARHRIRRKAQDLKDDPAGTVADLEQSAFGCDWLLRHWRKLASVIDSCQCWDGKHRELAMLLTGRTMGRSGPSDPIGRRLFEAMRSLSPEVTMRSLGEQKPMIDPGSARRFLIGFAQEQIARLDALRADRWAQVEGPQREAVATEGRIDISKAGQLRRRYEREAALELNRNLSMLLRIRRERRQADQEALSHAERGKTPHRLGGDQWWNGPELPVPPGCRPSRAPWDAHRAPDRRNEPPKGASKPTTQPRNPSSLNNLHHEPPVFSFSVSQRTEPLNEVPAKAPIPPIEGLGASALGDDQAASATDALLDDR